MKRLIYFFACIILHAFFIGCSSKLSPDKGLTADKVVFPEKETYYLKEVSPKGELKPGALQVIAYQDNLNMYLNGKQCAFYTRVKEPRPCTLIPCEPKKCQPAPGHYCNIALALKNGENILSFGEYG